MFLFSFPGRAPVIFHWISEGLYNSSFTEEIFNFKNWKTRSTCFFFFQFYEPPDLKACFEVIRLPSWPQYVKSSAKMQFFTFLIPWKICFWINDKSEIKFFRKRNWKCSHSSKSNLTFQTFKGTLKMLQITFCPQIQQKKSLKWP